MSFDCQIERVCPHITIREYHQFFSDLQTIYLDRPMSSELDVDLYLNDELVPRNHPISGWQLQKDETKVGQDYKKIVFNKPRKSTDDYVEISYHTIQYNCRRCHNQGLCHDVSFTKLGKIKLVREGDKLLQDLEKYIITVIGSNFFYPWYGTSLITLIGRVDSVRAAVVPLMTRQVLEGIEKLKSLQIQQSYLQPVYATEMINQVISVNVVQSDVDPTHFQVTATIASMAGNSLEIFKRAKTRVPILLQVDKRTGRYVPQVAGLESTNFVQSTYIPGGR